MPRLIVAGRIVAVDTMTGSTAATMFIITLNIAPVIRTTPSANPKKRSQARIKRTQNNNGKVLVVKLLT